MSDPASEPSELKPIGEVDQQVNLEGLIGAYHRLRWFAIGVLGALVAMAIVAGSVIIIHQQNQIDNAARRLVAACDFYRDLSGVPVTAQPPLKQPSRLGVLIVVDSRVAAHGLGCLNIPAADPSVKRWAAYYHIPLP